MNIGFFIDALITVVGVTTPILLAATGELVVEKSGVLNLGIEGMMLIGAVTGFAVTLNTDNRLMSGVSVSSEVADVAATFRWGWDDVQTVTERALAAAFTDAGLPPGVLNVLTGPGGELGDALVCDPRVRKVSFTGSTAVGEHIARTAGVKKLSLELGASCPVVILPDADVVAAAAVVARRRATGAARRVGGVAGSRRRPPPTRGRAGRPRHDAVVGDGA